MTSKGLRPLNQEFLRVEGVCVRMEVFENVDFIGRKWRLEVGEVYGVVEIVKWGSGR